MRDVRDSAASELDVGLWAERHRCPYCRPVAVFEVLSPSTSCIDAGLKVRDYEAVPSITTYALFEAKRARVLVHRRDAAGLFSGAGLELLEGVEATLALPDLGIEIPFSAIYEGVPLEG